MSLILGIMTDFHLKPGHFCIMLLSSGSYLNVPFQLVFSDIVLARECLALLLPNDERSPGYPLDFYWHWWLAGEASSLFLCKGEVGLMAIRILGICCTSSVIIRCFIFKIFLCFFIFIFASLLFLSTSISTSSRYDVKQLPLNVFDECPGIVW